MSCSHKLRLQQEQQQLRKARENPQLSTVQAQMFQRRLCPPQRRPLSLPMLPDHRPPGHTGPVHLAHLNQIDIHMAERALPTGNIGLGVKSQAMRLMQGMAVSVDTSGPPVQMYLPRVLSVHLQMQGHLYPQEARRHPMLSRRQEFVPGAESYLDGLASLSEQK